MEKQLYKQHVKVLDFGVRPAAPDQHARSDIKVLSCSKLVQNIYYNIYYSSFSYLTHLCRATLIAHENLKGGFMQPACITKLGASKCFVRQLS